jgi:hypothetical protein
MSFSFQGPLATPATRRQPECPPNGCCRQTLIWWTFSRVQRIFQIRAQYIWGYWLKGEDVLAHPCSSGQLPGAVQGQHRPMRCCCSTPDRAFQRQQGAGMPWPLTVMCSANHKPVTSGQLARSSGQRRPVCRGCICPRGLPSCSARWKSLSSLSMRLTSSVSLSLS